MTYAHTEEERWKSWPKGQTLEVFWDRRGRKIVDDTLSMFVSQQVEGVRAIQPVAANLQVNRDDFRTKFEKFIAYFETFVETTKIDQHFITYVWYK